MESNNNSSVDLKCYETIDEMDKFEAVKRKLDFDEPSTSKSQRKDEFEEPVPSPWNFWLDNFEFDVNVDKCQFTETEAEFIDMLSYDEKNELFYKISDKDKANWLTATRYYPKMDFTTCMECDIKDEVSSCRIEVEKIDCEKFREICKNFTMCHVCDNVCDIFYNDEIKIVY